MTKQTTRKLAAQRLAAVALFLAGAAFSLMLLGNAEILLSKIGAGLIGLSTTAGAVLMYVYKGRGTKDAVSRRSGISSVLLAALLLGPVGLNAGEVRTWSLASTNSEAATPLPGVLRVGSTSGPTQVMDVLACIGAALLVIAATAGCILAVLAAAATPPLGWLAMLAIRAVCAAGIIGAILIAIAECSAVTAAYRPVPSADFAVFGDRGPLFRVLSGEAE